MRLGDMSSTDAKSAYVKLLNEVDPTWQSKQADVGRPKRKTDDVANAADRVRGQVLATPEQLNGVLGYTGHWIGDRT